MFFIRCNRYSGDILEISKNQINNLSSNDICFSITDDLKILNSIVEFDEQGKPIAVRDMADVDSFYSTNLKRLDKEGKLLIGIVRLGGIGDVLHITAIAKAIKHKFPSCYLKVYINIAPEIFNGNTDIDRVEFTKDLWDDVIEDVKPLHHILYDCRYYGYTFFNTTQYPEYQEERNKINTQNKWWYDIGLCGINGLYKVFKMNFFSLLSYSLGLDIKAEDMYLPVKSHRLVEQLVGQYKYVTVHNSGGGGKEHVKNWYNDRWAEVAKHCKDEYGLKVIQVGGAHDNRIDNTLDFRGVLNINESAYVVKNALFHMGIEGIMAHIAKTVNTPAIILFGPTPEEFFGYKENININAKMCDPCWFLNEGWSKNCFKNLNKKCIDSISVTMVNNAVDSMVKKLMKDLYAQKHIIETSKDDKMPNRKEPWLLSDDRRNLKKSNRILSSNEPNLRYVDKEEYRECNKQILKIIDTIEITIGKTLVINNLNYLLSLVSKKIDVKGVINEVVGLDKIREIRDKYYILKDYWFYKLFKVDEFNTVIIDLNGLEESLLKGVEKWEFIAFIRQLISLVTDSFVVVGLDKKDHFFYTTSYWMQNLLSASFALKDTIDVDGNVICIFSRLLTKERSVLWYGSPYDQSGYGEANRGYLRGLYNVGVDVILKPIKFWIGEPVPLDQEFTKILKDMTNKPEPLDDYYAMSHMTPDAYVYKTNALRNFGYTPFETNSVPTQWLKYLQRRDLVFVPSEFNVKIFSSYGVRATVIPHGVDTDLYNPVGEKFALGLPKGTFVFGTNFDWTERKNPEALLRAYWTAGFTEKDKVVLLLKTMFIHAGNLQNGFKYINKKIEDFKAKCPQKYYPPVKILENAITSTYDMPKFYRSIDCLLSPSRGEGWSLSNSESLACGLPIITTLTGNTFCNDTNSIIVPGVWTPIPMNSEFLKHSSLYKGHSWLDVDVDKMAEKIMWVYKNQGKAREIGKKARKDMAHWSWDNAAKLMYKKMRSCNKNSF